MIIRSIEYIKGEERIAYAEINPFKKEIKPIQKEPKEFKTIASLSALDTTFRIYTFPLKDKDKIKNLIEGQLQFDLPLPIEEIEYAYFIQDNKAFCVITRKEVIRDLKEKYGKVDEIDSDIFAIIRLFNLDIGNSGKVIHMYGEYGFYLEFENNFPTKVNVISEKEIEKYYDKSIFLSGKIPKNLIGTAKILKNPFNDPKFGVTTGIFLKPIFTDIGIDFLHKERSDVTLKILISAIVLFFAIIFIDIGLFIQNIFLKKEIQEVKSAEKEIFIKYFSQTTPVFDPLNQAKGLVAAAKTSKKDIFDVINVLNDIGKAKKIAKIKEIYQISINPLEFSIKGIALNLKDIETFKNLLSSKYNVVIEETVTNVEGEIRFSIKGKYKWEK